MKIIACAGEIQRIRPVKLAITVITYPSKMTRAMVDTGGAKTRTTTKIIQEGRHELTISASSVKGTEANQTIN